MSQVRYGKLMCMENLVAVEVALKDRSLRYFLTWGRIQSEVDPEPLAELVLQYSLTCSLGGIALRARVCSMLREAADSHAAPYFYEGFWLFTQRQIPFGDGYEAWRSERDAAMRSGKEIYYCGKPRYKGRL